MRRKISAVILIVSVLLAANPLGVHAADGHFSPYPSTDYAKEFIQKCEGQQWFIDETERLLNMEQKTLDTVHSAADFALIKSIGLRDSEITGTIPRAIGEFTELRYLFMADNQLGGSIPDELFSLPKLSNIDLSGNAYAGAIPEKFGTMAALKTLNLRGNTYIGSIPTAVLGNTQIAFLDVSSNQLTGGIPVGLSDMTALEYLALSDNAWGGILPDLSALTQLKSLSAWNCKLTGEIPDTLYTLTNLQVLDLAGNSLSGALKPALGNLVNLQLLSVGTNTLHGEIPATLRALTKLQTLDLSDNAFSGVLPDAFASMALIQKIHFENNRLRGVIPATLKTKYDSGTTVYAQNNYMTGAALTEMKSNEKNFADGAKSGQYQLTMPEYVQVNKDNAVDLYAYLTNKSLADGNTTRKPRLPKDGYLAAIIAGDGTKLTLERTDGAMLVKATADIPKAESISVKISINDNTGSAYSETVVKLTTDALSSGGGIGGGGVATAPALDTHEPYVNGYPDGIFRPEAAISREEIAKMLIGILGEETGETLAYTTFRDVAKDRWSAVYIERANRLKYLLGDTDGAFRPEDAMTRAELAACLVRAADNIGKKSGETNAFTDVISGKWYAESVSRAATLGLVTGYEDGSFRPEGCVTRAEAVTMMNRLTDRDPQTASALKTLDCPFSDIAVSNWAYLQIMEAAVKHAH